jgi:outer membrane protein OmpA-like peptidoglycan-associated protein
MWLMGAGLVLAGLMLGGCNNSLKEENALLAEENEALRAQLSERNAALDSAHDELRSKDQRLADLRRQLESDEGQTAADPFRGIAGVTGSVGVGEVTATLESDILFDSGKATLKSSAKRALDEVARVIVREYPGRSIRVAGHTDTDPIRKSGYKSNYHLGFERAYAVRDYLIQRGVPERDVYIASHGPNRTLGSKQQSRRVEIVVVVNED